MLPPNPVYHSFPIQHVHIGFYCITMVNNPKSQVVWLLTDHANKQVIHEQNLRKNWFISCLINNFLAHKINKPLTTDTGWWFQPL